MEAVATVGGALVSALLQPLIENLGSADLLKFARSVQVDKELAKWESGLSDVRAVLNDAEERQITSHVVRNWLGKLQDFAYDVEDVVDELLTEASRSRFMAESQAGTSVVHKFLTGSCFKPRAGLFNAQMRSKLGKITLRLQEIVADKNRLALTNAEGRSNRVMNERAPTSSLVKEPKVYGREKDEEDILEALMSGGESDASRFTVISIVGMGGIGKTTLAQLVYNNERVKFDYKAWVCVSDDFDILNITKAILRWEGGEGKDLNFYQEELKQKLSGKKFLIVLDDVWSENYEKWTTVCSPFAAAAPGSKIIVTTRSRGVSQMTGSVHAHHMRVLSHDDCLTLFAQHALGAGNFDACPDLKKMGEEIVRRGNGLPLAIKTLGGLLRGKHDHREWEDILNSKIWNLPEEKSGIFPALRLSYHHLPSPLKQCFAYCAIFPKDYEFRENELVLLWMAEGFLQQSTKNKRTTFVGHQYFQELVSRSFFELSSSDKSRYVMHDLISDLAQSVSAERCFNFDDKPDTERAYAKVRHSAFTRRGYESLKRFEALDKMKSLRTLLALPIDETVWGGHFLSPKFLEDLVPKLKCLKVLSLAHYLLVGIPSSIGNLKHLRYLDLSDTPILSLPESVGEFFNLQTLRLSGCRKLTKLPEGISNLINLQHLDICFTINLCRMPPHMGNLTNLHTLSKFIVGKGDGLGIAQLKNLCDLQGRLELKGLHNVVDIRDAEVANLKEKAGLNDICLEWIDQFDGSRNERLELQVFNSLRPHQNLEKLSIISYGGTVFPSWVGDSSFNNMAHLTIRKCGKVTSLPPLGQLPSLKGLIIGQMDGMKDLGAEFDGDGSFSSLETLHIENMVNLEQWSASLGVNDEGKVHFPNLRVLTIINCPKLVGTLPICLPSLEDLHIASCPQLGGLPQTLPSLEDLYIDSCPQLGGLPETLPSLTKLWVSGCQEIVLRKPMVLTSLSSLNIREISGLSCLDGTLILQAMVALEALTIEDCGELVCLWHDRTDLDNLTSLKRLEVRGCKELASLVEGEEGLLPRNLEVLGVSSCPNLEKLPNGLHSLTTLRDLFLIDCQKLACFPGTELPKSLRIFRVFECQSLVSLPSVGIAGDGYLEDLLISGCPSLSSFPIGEFPSSLRSISICRGLNQLFESLQHRLTHLVSLDLEGSVVEIEYFPERGLRIPTLTTLSISNFRNLRSLPNHMRHLSSLKSLTISHCRSLESFPEGGLPRSLTHLDLSYCASLQSLPEEGLPENLITLSIRDCKSLRAPTPDWGLQGLTSLKYLSIERASLSTQNVRSFPDADGLLLPSSLITLSIGGFKNLKCISKELNKLTFLQELSIQGCPWLWSLPTQGLPPTLGSLRIRSCPLLKFRCLKLTRNGYWRRIDHIPQVDIR